MDDHRDIPPTLGGDEDFDPDRISRELERLRNPTRLPSDRELLLSVRIQALMEVQSNLQHDALLHPEREADISERLQALNTELARLLAEYKAEQQEDR
jgi:hypothetical protein